MKRAHIALAAALAASVAIPALATSYYDVGGAGTLNYVLHWINGSGVAVPASTTNPLPVTGTISATLNGFAPASVYSTPLSVSTTSSRVALPAGTVVVVYNTGASSAFVQLGNSSVTATTSNDAIQPGSWMAFTVGSNTNLAAVTASGTTSLNISGGSGLPTGAGGGSGGASTIANGADVAEGNTGDTAWNGTGAATVVSALKGVFSQMNTGVGTDGSASPTQGLVVGGNDGTNYRRLKVGTDGSLYVNFASQSGDACQNLAKTTAVINLTAGGQVITGTAAKKTYICAINIISATAQNIALVEGTGSVCATGTAGLSGGATAATGWNFAANGGLTLGNGGYSVINGITNAANVCLLLSSTGQTSGAITYAQQ